MNLNNVEFIKSAAKKEDIICDTLPKIVFSGKSNVGKSSVINKLLGRKQFARVSNKPGKTIHINYYLVDNTAYLIDLPGYGYANVARREYIRWSKLMESFFSKPEHITLGIMIVDARHKPTADDVTMAEWFKAARCSFLVLANKTDKVKNSERVAKTTLIRDTLRLDEKTRVLEFSALKGQGRDELLENIMRTILGA